MALPFSTIKPERVDEDVRGSNRLGLHRHVRRPAYLGWHTPRADFVAGYGFYAPTGRYEAGANDNVGLGMWSHEIQGGVTAFLDAGEESERGDDSVLRDPLEEEGSGSEGRQPPDARGRRGLQRAQASAARSASATTRRTKSHDDSGRDIPELLLRALNLRDKNRIFGIGPDVTMGLFQRGTTAGLVNVRYLWDSAAKSSFEGSTFWISFTIAKLQP